MSHISLTPTNQRTNEPTFEVNGTRVAVVPHLGRVPRISRRRVAGCRLTPDGARGDGGVSRRGHRSDAGGGVRARHRTRVRRHETQMRRGTGERVVRARFVHSRDVWSGFVLSGIYIYLLAALRLSCGVRVTLG